MSQSQADIRKRRRRERLWYKRFETAPNAPMETDEAAEERARTATGNIVKPDENIDPNMANAESPTGSRRRPQRMHPHFRSPLTPMTLTPATDMMRGYPEQKGKNPSLFDRDEIKSFQHGDDGMSHSEESNSMLGLPFGYKKVRGIVHPENNDSGFTAPKSILPENTDEGFRPRDVVGAPALANNDSPTLIQKVLAARQEPDLGDGAIPESTVPATLDAGTPPLPAAERTRPRMVNPPSVRYDPQTGHPFKTQHHAAGLEQDEAYQTAVENYEPQDSKGFKDRWLIPAITGFLGGAGEGGLAGGLGGAAASVGLNQLDRKRKDRGWKNQELTKAGQAVKGDLETQKAQDESAYQKSATAKNIADADYLRDVKPGIEKRKLDLKAEKDANDKEYKNNLLSLRKEVAADIKSYREQIVELRKRGLDQDDDRIQLLKDRIVEMTRHNKTSEEIGREGIQIGKDRVEGQKEGRRYSRAEAKARLMTSGMTADQAEAELNK